MPVEQITVGTQANVIEVISTAILGGDGASAYELAVTHGGFEGTMEEWLAALVGPPGEPGEPGADGAAGQDGIDGLTGPKGDQGDPGDPGADGADGADSTVPGPPGATGGVWTTGSGTPNPALGANGDLYLRSNGDVYQRSAGSWGSPVFNIAGGVSSITDHTGTHTGAVTLDVYSTAEMIAFLGNKVGWAITDGDVWLPPIVIGSVGSRAVATHGMVHGNGMRIDKIYTQTQKPAGGAELLGDAILVKYDITNSDSTAFIGPTFSSGGLISSRGSIALEGYMRYAADSGPFGAILPAVSDGIIFKNAPVGTDRTITPGTRYWTSSVYEADGATVGLIRNDFFPGGAAFCDNQFYLTENSGILDGSDWDSYSFVSGQFFIGNTEVRTRAGFVMEEFTQEGIDVTPGPDGYPSVLRGQSFPGCDTGYGVVHLQIGLWIKPLVRAERNVGLWNANSYVDEPTAQTIAATSDALVLDSSVLEVNPTSDLSLVAAPTIPDGYPGERIRIVNVNATHYVQLNDESLNAGSNLKIAGSRHLRLGPNESAELQYQEAVAAWVVRSRSNPARGGLTFDMPAGGAIAVGEVFGFPLLDFLDPSSGLHSNIYQDGSGTLNVRSGSGELVYLTGNSPAVRIGATGTAGTGSGYVQYQHGADTAFRVGLGDTLGGKPAISWSSGDGNFATTSSLYREDASKLVLANSALEASVLIKPITTTTDRTLALTDAGTDIDVNNSAASLVTIPLNSAVAFPIGTVIWITNRGGFPVTITATGGVTTELGSSRSLVVDAQHSSVKLRKRATDTWVIDDAGPTLASIAAAAATRVMMRAAFR